MTRVDPHQLLPVLREAAAIINEVYSGPFDVEFKAPGDPVTIADKRANELIVNRLGAVFPEIPIVAEESGEENYARFREAPTVFFVDPLDGTREFVRRNGEFVTMVGVIEGERPTVGVILQPTTGAGCLGVVGVGAWSFDAHGVERPTRVSETTDVSATRIVASRSGDTERYEAARQRFGVGSITPLGSAGMKGLAIARGEADAYVTPGYGGHRWDACALEALIVAAGGRFTDAKGELLDYRAASLVNDRGLVCSNAHLHRRLVALFAESQARRSDENSAT